MVGKTKKRFEPKYTRNSPLVVYGSKNEIFKIQGSGKGSVLNLIPKQSGIRFFLKGGKIFCAKFYVNEKNHFICSFSIKK